MWMLLFKGELLLAVWQGGGSGGANLPPGSINLHRDGEFLAPAQVAGPTKESRAPSRFAGSVGLVWSGCGGLAHGCRSERPHGRQR